MWEKYSLDQQTTSIIDFYCISTAFQLNYFQLFKVFACTMQIAVINKIIYRQIFGEFNYFSVLVHTIKRIRQFLTCHAL